jgi:molybdenum cofactor biosynthesis enzyme MoaA
VQEIIETDSGSYRVLGLDVEVTNRCNTRCAICPREEIERPLGMMSEETFRMLTDRIRASSVLGVIFSGFGEPLLHPSLPQTCPVWKNRLRHVLRRLVV